MPRSLSIGCSLLLTTSSALAQPAVWSLGPLSTTIESEAFADDPNDLVPPCSRTDLVTTFTPGFLGNSTGTDGHASCGLLVVTCPLIGVGHSRVEVNGIGTQQVSIKWKVYAWTYHNCDMRDGYIAQGISDLVADIGLIPVNVPPGTQLTVDYKWDAKSSNSFFPENVVEDDGSIDQTQLDIDGNDLLGGGFNFVGVEGTRRRIDQRGVLPLLAGSTMTVSVGARADSLIQFPGLFVFHRDAGRAEFSGEIVLSLNGPPPPTFPGGGGGGGGGPASVQLEFGLDLGSDAEIGDANLSTNTFFDPGDAYLWRGAPLPLTGANGIKNDTDAMLGNDPDPRPPFPPQTGPPYCSGMPPIIGFIVPWFDMDDFDTLSFDIRARLPNFPQPLAAPIARFNADCIFDAEYLLVSFDDDTGQHWTGSPPASCGIPTFSQAPTGATYGTTAARDEVVEIELIPATPQYFLGGLTPFATEEDVHISLAPNPDVSENFDDDVDGLDAFDDPAICNVWYFSADHEAAYDSFGGAASLNPGMIYQVIPGTPPTPVVNAQTHLGLPSNVDIDAFEFVWLYDPNSGGDVFGIIFSVADNDPLTPDDESGGLDPAMLYASHFTGSSFALLNFPLQDDIDAISAYRTSLVPLTPPAPCPGDANADRVVNGADLSVLLGQFGQIVIPCAGADFNCDGIINAADLSVLLSNFGNVCP